MDREREPLCCCDCCCCQWCFRMSECAEGSASVILCRSWIAARNSRWQQFLFCGVYPSVFFVSTQICLYLSFTSFFGTPDFPRFRFIFGPAETGLSFFVPTISGPSVWTSNLCLSQLHWASFALSLSCCSGEVPYIFPRVGTPKNELSEQIELMLHIALHL